MQINVEKEGFVGVHYQKKILKIGLTRGGQFGIIVEHEKQVEDPLLTLSSVMFNYNM